MAKISNFTIKSGAQNLLLSLLLTLSLNSCANQKKINRQELQRGNLRSLLKSFSWKDFLQNEFSSHEDKNQSKTGQKISVGKIWLPNSLQIKGITFGELESKRLVLESLFDLQYPHQYLDGPKEFLNTLRAQMIKNLWDEVKERKDWMAMLTVLSNLRLFQARMVRPLVYEFVKNDKKFNVRWNTLEKKVAPFLTGLKKSKTLPGFFNLTGEAQSIFLYHISQSQISFFSQMIYTMKAKINYQIFNQTFGPIVEGWPLNQIPGLGQTNTFLSNIEIPNWDFEEGYFEESFSGKESNQQDVDEETSEFQLANQKKKKVINTNKKFKERAKELSLLKSYAKRPAFLRGKCHLVFNPEANQLEGDIDVAIVGGGSTGSYLASLLWRAGYKVVVLEKGPYSLDLSGQLENEEINEEIKKIYGANAGPYKLQNRFMNGPFMDAQKYFINGQILQLKPKLVGGGDTLGNQFNIPLQSPMIRQYLNNYIGAGRFPRSFYNLEKYAELATEVGTLIHTRSFFEDDINEREKALAEKAHGNGLYVLSMQTGLYPVNEGTELFKQGHSSHDAYLKFGIRDSNNPLCVLPRIEVDKLVMQDFGGKKRVQAIQAKALKRPLNDYLEIFPPVRLVIPDFTRFELRPKITILSAGPFADINILKKSRYHSKELGQGLTLNLGQLVLGVYNRAPKPAHQPLTRAVLGPAQTGIEDHGNPLIGRTHMIIEWPLAPSQLAQLAPQDLELAYGLFLAPEQVRVFHVSLLDEIMSENFASIGEVGHEHIWSSSLIEKNWDRLKRGLRDAAQLHFSLGADAVYLPTMANRFKKSSKDSSLRATNLLAKNMDEFNQYIEKLKPMPYRFPLISLAASGGLLRSEKNDDSSLLLPDYSLSGVANLYVMDSSVLPPGIGPYHSTILKALGLFFVNQLGNR